jgi:hypothetical protein
MSKMSFDTLLNRYFEVVGRVVWIGKDN